MTKNRTMPTEQEKQTQPMQGETDPKDAFKQARIFAAKEKARLINRGAKLK